MVMNCIDLASNDYAKKVFYWVQVRRQHGPAHGLDFSRFEPRYIGLGGVNRREILPKNPFYMANIKQLNISSAEMF